MDSFSLPSIHASFWTFSVFACCVLIGRIATLKRSAIKNMPYAAKVSDYAPVFVSNILYAFRAPKVIGQGYDRFKDVVHRIVRADGDAIILPSSALDEVTALPQDIADGVAALERDLLGPYTGLDIILESRLHHQLVQRKLTPALTALVPELEEEVTAAINDYFPKDSYEWTKIEPYHLLLKVSARVTARVMVGKTLCRDPEWLDISTNYTENIFRTIVILRLFPPWLQPLISWFCPTYWIGLNYMKRAKRFMSPLFKQRLEEIDSGSYKPNPSQSTNAFSWLVDMAKGKARDADKLTHTQMLLAIAGIHTTLLRELSVLYDLAANPQYISDLRSEIEQTSVPGWSKASYAQLQKLDSFLRESQRLAPPTTLGIKRIMRQDYTLNDGTFLPQGSYVCLPIVAIENDPVNTPNPDKFDGYRSYQARRQNPDSIGHEFTSMSRSVLGFGYGRSACPGRFFASLQIKMVFTKLLSEYDVSLLPGQGRPKHIYAHEFVFPNPWQKILVKRRAVQATTPF